MTIHSVHPDTHTHGLADDCERCAEHAEHPVASLDDTNLRRLLQGIRDGGEPLSYTDAVASARLRTALEHAGHLARTAPELFFCFLDGYRVHVERYSHTVYEQGDVRFSSREETVTR